MPRSPDAGDAPTPPPNHDSTTPETAAEASRREAMERIVKHLVERDFRSAANLVGAFVLPRQEVEHAVIVKALIPSLDEDSLGRTIEIITEFNLSTEVLAQAEVQRAAMEAVVRELSSGNAQSALKIVKEFKLSKEVLAQAAVQDAIRAAHQMHADAARQGTQAWHQKKWNEVPALADFENLATKP